MGKEDISQIGVRQGVFSGTDEQVGSSSQSTMTQTNKYIHHTNYDATLISYYEEKDYYKAHTDSSILTYLYWCHKEPKKFEGGDLTLPELDADITYKNNRLVVFPSWRLHEVTPIKMIEEVHPYSGYGRYCITNFAYIR
jgi:Rps23 Pro-64 3,4-dihydroxylase Tpa1-like proline 4-hydroxylase